MPTVPTAEAVLQWVSLVLSVLLVLRLYQQGLHATYRWFFLLLMFDAVRSSVLLTLPVRSTTYAYVYLWSWPVLWLLYILVLKELYELVLRDHKGVASIGGYAIYIGVAVAVVLSIISARPELSSPDGNYPALKTFFVFGRVVLAILLLLLITIAGILLWFPIRLRRNIVYYCIGYVIFFLSKTLLLLLRNVLGADVTRILSSVNLALESSVLLFWLLQLNSRGQEKSVAVGHSWNPDQAETLVKQLDSINEALLRAARR